MYLVLAAVFIGFSIQIGGGAFLIQRELLRQGKEGGYKTILLFLLPLSLLLYWLEGVFYESTLDAIIANSRFGWVIVVAWVVFIFILPLAISYWLMCKSSFYKFLFGDFEQDELPFPMSENITEEEQKKP